MAQNDEFTNFLFCQMLKFRQHDRLVIRFSNGRLKTYISSWAKTSLETSSGISIAPNLFYRPEKVKCVIYSIKFYGDTSIQRGLRTNYFAVFSRPYSD